MFKMCLIIYFREHFCVHNDAEDVDDFETIFIYIDTCQYVQYDAVSALALNW